MEQEPEVVKRPRGRPRTRPVEPPKAPTPKDNAGRPQCSRCGDFHWMFVACADAEKEAVREDTATEARVKAATPHVTYRTRNPGLHDKLINYRQIAPGVFVRKDSPYQAAR